MGGDWSPFRVEDVAGENTECRPVAFAATGEREELSRRPLPRVWKAGRNLGLGSLGVFVCLATLERLGWGGTCASFRLMYFLGSEGGRAGGAWASSHPLSFSEKASYEDSSPRTYPAAGSPHQLKSRTSYVLLADPITVQSGTAGETCPDSSTGLFAQAESSEERRARSGT